MKASILLVSVFGLTLHGVQEATLKTHSIKTPHGMISITVNTFNSQDNTIKNHSSVTCKQALSQSLSHDDEVAPNSFSWFSNLSAMHCAVGLAALSTLGAYGYVWYQLQTGKNYLAQASLWSSWYNTINLQDVLGIATQEITQKLLEEIHRRYSTHQDLAHMLNPMLIFLQEIEKEEALLTWYQKIHTLIEKMKMQRIFLVSLTSFETITERLQRLTYYKNIFYSWTKEYASYETDLQKRSVSLQDDVDFADFIDQMSAGHMRTILQEHIDRITPAYNVV